MKRMWIHKAHSFKDADEFERAYYLNMSAAERVGTVQLLREICFKVREGSRRESRKGLRRVIRVIQ